MELTSEQTLKLKGNVGFFAAVGEQQDARLNNWSGARKNREKKEKRCSMKNKSQNKKQAGFAASQQAAADNSSPAG